MYKKFLRAICRMAANHCIFPGLRVTLFKLSGINIGRNVYINLDFIVIDDYNGNMVSIGDGVAIAPRVTIITNSYPNDSFIGQDYHVGKEGRVKIYDGAWIGTGVIIQPDISIGKGSIIGSGCVVTHDVPEYAIFVGVPGKKIGDVRNKDQKQ